MRSCIIILLSLIAASANAQTPAANEIVDKSENLLKGKTSIGTYEMTVVTPEYERYMKMKYWWDDANDKSLIQTIAPKKEAGNKWLKIGTEMWNYLRSTETTIKIPPSMMLQSWNGSDFSNDDLVRESSLVKDYTHEILSEEEINGEMCWKIVSRPKPEAAVVWGKLYLWIRKKDNLAAVTQYFDEKGQLVRYMVFSEVQTMNGRTLPTRWTMYNKTKEGNRTEFKMLDVRFDAAIPEHTFSLRELERRN